MLIVPKLSIDGGQDLTSGASASAAGAGEAHYMIISEPLCRIDSLSQAVWQDLTGGLGGGEGDDIRGPLSCQLVDILICCAICSDYSSNILVVHLPVAQPDSA